jgi:ribosomal protein S27E
LYLVCWNHDCRQTYDAEKFGVDAVGVNCGKCGGTLISPSGKVQISRVSEVIKTVDPVRMEESKKKFNLPLD